MIQMQSMGYRGKRFYRETDEKPHITKSLILRILKYFLPYWKLMIVLFMTVIFTSILGVIPSILTKNIIDIALPKKNLTLLVVYILLSFATTLLLNIIAVGQSYLNSIVSKSIIRDLRSIMYNHLEHMSISFFSNAKTGEITSRINNDIGGIESVFSNTFIQLLSGIFVFLTTAATLFYTNWMLAIVSLLTLPLFVIPTRKVGKRRWEIALKTQSKLAELTNIITETLNISGMFLIKLFTKEKEKYKEFEKVNNEVTQLQIRETIIGRWFFMTIQTFIAIGPMLIYLVGGIILIKYNSITIGGIVMFVSLISRLYGPVNTFSNIHVDIIRSLALFERIFQYLDLKSEIYEKENSIVVNNVKGDIKFDHVYFSYDGLHDTLKDINFEIKPGQMAALVGPSGAGKTTITYLLPRLYDVKMGKIFLDGVDIRDVSLTSLRNHIGMVTQDTYLFNTTIKENLLFARQDATDEEIINACKAAYIHDFIESLPNGYDTIVGDRGIKLSGGEKQRISIARTLLKNPKIIIFDEATSALDSNSEFYIQKALEPLLKSRTSLVIAHRLSTIIAADIIFVVVNGEIVEKGSHEELLKKGGVYKDLYNTQFRMKE
ncbi:ABC transporter ATP-binding protein [Thermoanaerobacterium sp. R66]|nr:ABC transporter ATP-binding protein [Thermoanaerobacterium sp. R66]MDE4542392.1 ABC transporter ATP-binding protein [Thermoanaerobacterium sp. R66]